MAAINAFDVKGGELNSILKNSRLGDYEFGNKQSNMPSSDMSCKYNQCLSRSTHESNNYSDNTESDHTSSDNTTPKMYLLVSCQSDGKSIVPSNCKCSTTQANASYHADYFHTEQRSFVGNHQSLEIRSSVKNYDQENFQEYIPCNSHLKCEAIRSSSHLNLRANFDRNIDLKSSAPFADDCRDIESHPPCWTSHESNAFQGEIQTKTATTKSSICNCSFGNKPIKNCLVIWIMFNITLFVILGVLISMLLTEKTYQECRLCTDIKAHAKMLNGGLMKNLSVQEYLKGKGEDGRCCLDHTFIFELIAQNNPIPLDYTEKNPQLADRIVKAISENQYKTAIHLQSLPFISQTSAHGNNITWNFTGAIRFGSFREETGNGAEIPIPHTGVYYIYAMVQYRFVTHNRTSGLDYIPTFEEFPLSVSLYKIQHPGTFIRLNTVTVRCPLGQQLIEHNIHIQKSEHLTKGNKVLLVVSNGQFLNNKQKVHQIGLFKVN